MVQTKDSNRFFSYPPKAYPHQRLTFDANEEIKESDCQIKENSPEFTVVSYGNEAKANSFMTSRQSIALLWKIAAKVY